MESVVRVRGLVTRFGQKVNHDQVDHDLRRGEVLGVVGGSGTGKSVLLRSIVGLNRPAEGRVEVLGKVPAELEEEERRKVEARWGVLFQDGALFSSMTVAQNVQVPLKEHLDLPPSLMDEIAAIWFMEMGY